MTVSIPLLLSLAVAPLPPTPATVHPARAWENLARLIGDSDYPRQAIARREQGWVSFRLTVLANGRVGGCQVTGSSGSPSIDARTCEIMVRRARFRPARDAQGNPVPDIVESRIGWWLSP